MSPSLFKDNEPLLPAPVTHPSTSTPSSASSPLARQPSSPLLSTRSKLNARKTSGMSEKVRGKQRAPLDGLDVEAGPADYFDTGDDDESDRQTQNRAHVDKSGRRDSGAEKSGREDSGGGRHVTVVFSNESESGGGNLDLWVEDGESVGSVKDQIRHLRPTLALLSLRLIYAGRLLTDGILLVPWLRSLEERVKRQAGGVGRDVENVLKEVGLGEEEDEEGDAAMSGEKVDGKAQGTGARGQRREGGKKGKSMEEKVWLHCNVGPKLEELKKDKGEQGGEETPQPRRRGFDTLLDAGLSPADVANMRRQFYESRGEEVPEGLDAGDVNDEHARALEEQWIEGDMTAETATTTSEGMYSSIMHGLLTGFLFPFMPYFFMREPPLPNFFDADAEARGEDDGAVSRGVANNPETGGEAVMSVVFGKRMQMGILLGTIINIAFGWLRFIN